MTRPEPDSGTTSPKRNPALAGKGTPRGLLPSLFFAFGSLGIVGATVPAAIPGAAARLGVASVSLLPAVSLLFFGLLAGVVVAAVPGVRATVLLPTGLGLQGVGLVLIAFSVSAPMFLMAAATAGVGFGLVEASATTLTRVYSSSGTSARLAWLNGASAVSAACAPLLLAVVPLDGLTVTTIAIVALPIGGLVIAFRARSAWPDVASPRADRPRFMGGQRRRLLLLAAALFLFVGAETILSGWSSVLPQMLLNVPPAYAAVGTSVFWTLMAGGRFLCAVVVRTGVPAISYFVVASVAASVVAVAGVFTNSVVSAVLLCAVVPLVAPGYALLLGSALSGVPASTAGRTTGWLIVTGSAGGGLISLGVAAVFGSAPTAVLSSVGVLLACTAAITWSSRSLHDDLLD